MTTQEETIDPALLHYAVQALAGNQTEDEVLAGLRHYGASPKAASLLLAYARRRKKASCRREGLRTCLFGAVVLIGGVIGLYITYSLAAPGQVFLVPTGILFLGASSLARGLFGMIMRI